MSPRRWLLLGLRIGLGALFLYAGVIKLWDIDSLAVDVANYRLVPGWAVPVFATVVPGVEVVCGACLLLGRWVKPAAWMVALMMVAFSVATGQAVLRGINLDCGCFGSGRSPVTGMTFVRDLALLAAALLTVWLAPGEASAKEAETEPTSNAG